MSIRRRLLATVQTNTLLNFFFEKHHLRSKDLLIFN